MITESPLFTCQTCNYAGNAPSKCQCPPKPKTPKVKIDIWRSVTLERTGSKHYPIFAVSHSKNKREWLLSIFPIKITLTL